MINEDHLSLDFTSHGTQQWREQKYWNEECDYCLKYYKNIVEYIFNKYSVKKVKPGQKKFVSLQELIDMCTHSGLFEIQHFAATFP